MANEPDLNPPEDEFSPAMRAAFDSYPSPQPDANFDARFWRELDARKNRYRGLSGLLRRIVEVEIEGMAVWRLGLSALGGSGTCALGFALLGAFSAPGALQQVAPLPLSSVPTATPATASRYARQLWDETARPPHRVRVPAKARPQIKGDLSCVFASHWA
jgi:hypothetical protein